MGDPAGRALGVLARAARAAAAAADARRAGGRRRGGPLDADGRAAAIKWPNDVLLDGRKVAGILAEGRPQEGWVVLGIGVNVAVEEDGVPARAARDRDLARVAIRRGRDGARALLERLAHWLAAAPKQAMDAYRARDALAGREISWRAGRGTALGVADDGRLRVRPDERREELLLDAGEVHLGSGRRADAPAERDERQCRSDPRTKASLIDPPARTRIHRQPRRRPRRRRL